MGEVFLRAIADEKRASLKGWEGERIVGEEAISFAANRSFFVIGLTGYKLPIDPEDVEVVFSPNASKRFPYTRVTLRRRGEENEAEADRETSSVSGNGGSAVPISADGYFLTNAHVVGEEGGPFYLWGLTEHGMRLAHARVAWRGAHGNNDLPDLALLHADLNPLAHFRLERAELPPVEAPVIVAGYGGMSPNQAGGKILKHGGWRDWNGGVRWRAFLHDAPLHPGDSGGLVAGLDGGLVGINAEVHHDGRWPGNILENYRARALHPDRDWLLALIAIDRGEQQVGCFAEFSQACGLFSETPAPEHVNSLGMAFFPVPLSFNEDEARTLLFSQHETCLRDYATFAENATSDGGHAEPSAKWKTTFEGYTDDHPVGFVTWHEARAFCEWLTSRERELGLIGPDDRYRLPSDLEWSFAIGIGHLEAPDQSPKERRLKVRDHYPWGTEWPPTQLSGNYRGPETEAETVAGTPPDGHVRAAPVGSFPLTHWGLSDLGGNVWEWCEDAWHPDESDVKSARGAAFSTENRLNLHSSIRRPVPLDAANADVGFRVVLERGVQRD